MRLTRVEGLHSAFIHMRNNKRKGNVFNMVKGKQNVRATILIAWIHIDIINEYRPIIVPFSESKRRKSDRLIQTFTLAYTQDKKTKQIIKKNFNRDKKMYYKNPRPITSEFKQEKKGNMTK